MSDSQKTISKKIKKAYEIYAPKNISLEQFAQMIEQDPKLLKAIGGKFSTFSLEAGKAFKEYEDKKDGESDDILRKKLSSYINEQEIERGAHEQAKIYEKIICSDDSIIDDALNFRDLSETERQDLARKIINGINKYFNIDTDLQIEYQDRYKGESARRYKFDFVKNFLRLLKRNRIRYSLKGQYLRKANKIVEYKHYDFLNFIGTLSHEYGHFIDENYPDLGMLGSQIAFYGFKVYVSSGHKDYRTQPTEFSSFKIGDVVSEHLQNVLIEQGKKRLSKLKVKLAGIRLKIDKIHDKLYKAKNDILKERGLFYDLMVEQRWDMYEKLEKDKSCTRIQKLLQQQKEAKDKYWDLWSKMYNIESMLKEFNEQQIQTAALEKQK
ncbi:MAG: hypothetical protein IKZ34_01385 [Alphaproteobacteria bacterium]|nr:hypothetical protein [Alphaproteobacteria bacterium]